MSENAPPKNFKIVAVGGTGQMVLHLYLQLYLLGVVRTQFEAVVVDSDVINPAILAMKSFFSELQYGPQRQEGLGNTHFPIIDLIPITPTGGDSALEVLTGDKSWNNPDLHPAHAFFSKDALRQNLKEGLFARPALSAVLSHEVLKSELLKSKPNSTVVIVSSVTGGTGGGLTAPVLDSILSFAEVQQRSKVKVRGVWFGDYFRPKSGLIQDDVVRFQSNQTMVLRSLGEAEASDDVHSYNIVGGPGFVGDFERDPKTEKAAQNVPWPKDETNPIWQGALALDYLLNDSAMEKRGEFKEREISNPSSRFSLKEAELRRRKALQMAERLSRKKAIIRMCRDPWARGVWGEGLVEIISHYWSIAAKKEGGKDAVRRFHRICQRALTATWRGEGGSFGLRGVFPELTTAERIRPGKMARIPWPKPREGTWAPDLFDDAEKAAQRLVATILFWTLREVR